jgi:hypothetical protein
MGTLSYMRSGVDVNVVMRRIPVMMFFYVSDSRSALMFRRFGETFWLLLQDGQINLNGFCAITW